jgi:hypothetical protein
MVFSVGSLSPGGEQFCLCTIHSQSARQASVVGGTIAERVIPGTGDGVGGC